MPICRRSLLTGCLPVGLFAEFSSCLQNKLTDDNDEQDTQISNLNVSIAEFKEEFLMNLNESIDNLNDQRDAAKDKIRALSQFGVDQKCE